MRKDIKEIVKRNWFFPVLLLGIIFIFTRRYIELPVSIVSHPDSQIAFSTQDGVLEQTWQPEVKMITGLSIPYYSENDFSCDVLLEIFSDDYSRTLVQKKLEDLSFKEGQQGKIEFSFDRISVTQGERCRIRVSLLDSSSEGILQIAAGSNYGGCMIQGNDTGSAAAILLTFVKYSRLFWLMAVLFPLLAYSLFMMVITGRKWEETVAVSLFFEGIFLYLFGLTEHLLWGIGFVYAVSVCALLAAIYFYNKKKLCLRDLLSPGIWIYLTLFGVILIASNGDWLGMRDELRHWGIAVRDMFYYDSFAKHVGTTVILPRYLPFTALIEYMFEYVNGIFSEDILFMAYQTMLLSASIIMCRLLQGKGRKKLFLPVMTGVICIPIIFFHNISSSIMVDSLMAVIVAYALICYYSEEMSWFNRIRIASALCTLALIKEIGLVFAGITALIIFGDIFFEGIRRKKINFKEMLYPVICVVLALGAYLSWQVYLSIPAANNYKESAPIELSAEVSAPKEKENTIEEEETVEIISAASASGITLEGLKNIFTGKGEGYQYQTTRNFLIELLDGETYSIGFLKLSFVDLLALMAFMFFSLSFLEYWNREKQRFYILAGMTLVSGACLCIFLQITYWFSFGPYEAMELTSVERYLGPYVCAIMMLAVYLVCDGAGYSSWKSVKADYLIYALTCFLVIATPIKDIVIESNAIAENTTEENIYGYDRIAEMLRSVADRGERAYFICSHSDGYAEYIFRNAVCPIVSEHENWNVVADEELFDKQYELYQEGEVTVHNEAVILPLEYLEGEIRKCEYVVVFHADELFIQSYASLFEGTEIMDGSVYRVDNESEGVLLQLIGRTGIKGWH